MATDSAHLPGSKWLWFVAVLLVVSPFFVGLFSPIYQLPFIVVTLFVFLVYACVEMKSGTVLSALDYSILLLAVLYCLSVIWGVSPRDALQEGLKQALYVSAYWLVSRSARTSGQRTWMLKVMALTTIVVGAGSFLLASGLVSYQDAILHGRLGGPFGYANTLAAVMLGGIGLILPLRAGASRLFDRILWGTGLYCSLLALILTYSRFGWIILPFTVIGMFLVVGRSLWLEAVLAIVAATAGIGIAVSPAAGIVSARVPRADILIWVCVGAAVTAAIETMSWITVQKARWIRWIVVVVAVLGILMMSSVVILHSSSIVARVRNISTTDDSVLARYWTYYDAIRAWLHESPLLGLGGAGWKSVFLMYRDMDAVIKLTHSSLIETLSEVGLQGALLLLSGWVLAVISIWKYWRHEASVETKAIWGGLLVGLASLLAHSLVDWDLSYPAVTVWVYVGIALARSVQPSVPNTRNGTVTSKWMRTASVSVTAMLLVVAVPLAAAPFLQLQAVALINEGDLTSAKKRYELARKLDPLNAGITGLNGEFLVTFGGTTGSMNDISEGVRLLERAKKLEPFNPKYLVKLATVYRQSNAYDRSFDYLEKASFLDPYSTDTLERALSSGFATISIQLRNGEVEAARQCLTRIRKLLDQFDTSQKSSHKGTHDIAATSRIVMARGKYLAFSGNLQQARSIFESLKADPDQPVRVDATVWLATLSIHSGNTAEGQKLTSQLMQTNSQIAQSIPINVQNLSLMLH